MERVPSRKHKPARELEGTPKRFVKVTASRTALIRILPEVVLVDDPPLSAT
jgi:hypothetical protein